MPRMNNEEGLGMTDEEMAEEYVLNHQKEGFNCFSCFSCDFSKNFGFKSGVPDSEFFNQVEQAFLAGLKAGRPKWHKVVDGDLPKENNLYLVAIKDNGLAIAYFNGLHWETKFNLGDFGHCLETVIAWCEIPKFEEK